MSKEHYYGHNPAGTVAAVANLHTQRRRYTQPIFRVRTSFRRATRNEADVAVNMLEAGRP